MSTAKPLGCPNCEAQSSFDLEITGQQGNASFQLIDVESHVVHAQCVQVETYDPERLHCRSCGTTVAEDELVVIPDGKGAGTPLFEMLSGPRAMAGLRPHGVTHVRPVDDLRRRPVRLGFGVVAVGAVGRLGEGGFGVQAAHQEQSLARLKVAVVGCDPVLFAPPEPPAKCTNTV